MTYECLFGSKCINFVCDRIQYVRGAGAIRDVERETDGTKEVELPCMGPTYYTNIFLNNEQSMNNDDTNIKDKYE